MDHTTLWNNTAAEYQRVFRQGQNDYNRSVIAFWEESGMLRPGSRVLDVGCGVGKYGVLLAERGCDVTLLDSAEEMLRFAAANMARFSTPWRTLLCDFHTAALPAKADYDFVFSTMSPAIADSGDLRRLSAFSRGWCFVSRFSAWSQPLRDTLLREAGLCPAAPHSDPAAACEALTAGVRALGYTPLTRQAPYDWVDVRSPEAMAESLLLRLEPAQRGDPALPGRLLEAARRHADADGLLRDAVFTRALWLSWRT